MTIDGTDYRKVDGAYAHLGWQSFNKGPGGSGWTSLSQYLWPFLDALAAAEEKVSKAVMLMRQVNIKAITAVEVKQDWKDFLAVETLNECTCENWKIYYPMFDNTLKSEILQFNLRFCPWCGCKLSEVKVRDAMVGSPTGISDAGYENQSRALNTYRMLNKILDDHEKRLMELEVCRDDGR